MNSPDAGTHLAPIVRTGGTVQYETTDHLRLYEDIGNEKRCEKKDASAESFFSEKLKTEQHLDDRQEEARRGVAPRVREACWPWRGRSVLRYIARTYDREHRGQRTKIKNHNRIQ